MTRFLRAYARLSGLGRRMRRRLGHRAAVTATGTALILAMTGGAFFAPPAHAATITVNETTCTLVDAIRAANTNAVVGGCASGAAGLDTIDLAADVTLTTSAANYYISDTGLPAITSEIILNGNGHTIARDGTAPDFRILYVGATGDLTLNDVTISGGKTTSSGGGFFLYAGTLAINGSTISGNSARWGGGGYNQLGSLTINGSVFRENEAYSGGGFYQDDDENVVPAVHTTITNSLFELNESASRGGAMYVDVGEMTITGSTFDNNKAGNFGGAIFSYFETADITISGSSLTNNTGDSGGAIFILDGTYTLVNSTLSGNWATVRFGGGIANYFGDLTLLNTTITDNVANTAGGGLYQGSTEGSTTVSRSIISGNSVTSGLGIEILGFNRVTADDGNVFGHGAFSSSDAFHSFVPGASDINASSDALDVPLGNILNPALADNGGPTPTHNLVLGSPALDMASDADCAADPIDGRDQRGYLRPFDVVGEGNDGNDTCDAGAVEYGSAPHSVDTLIYMSAKKSGTTADGVTFDNSDILKWDGTEWSKAFDGTDAHLDPNNKPKHNINAFFFEDDDIVMSFAQNGRKVFGLPGKVDGMDLVRWDGSAFSLWFDGSDVGLTKKTPEKIDALHLMPGNASPIGGSCEQYLLVSTQGPGAVPAYGGGTLKFGGEDVLGFCMTNTGEATAGFWHMVLDGSAVGLPKNSLDSISASDDGDVLYFTTSKAVNLGGGVSGGHSMIFAYDTTTGDFSGPLFIAADNGLGQMIDGLDMK